jgi:hypothetical protein
MAAEDLRIERESIRAMQERMRWDAEAVRVLAEQARQSAEDAATPVPSSESSRRRWRQHASAIRRPSISYAQRRNTRATMTRDRD